MERSSPFFSIFLKSLLCTRIELIWRNKDKYIPPWELTYLSEKCLKLNWNMMQVFSTNEWIDILSKGNKLFVICLSIFIQSTSLSTHQCKYGRLLLSCNLNLKWPQKFAILIEWHKTIQLLFNNKFLSFIHVKWTNSDLLFKSNVEQNMNCLWFSDWCLKSLSKFEFSCISHCIYTIQTAVWWIFIKSKVSVLCLWVEAQLFVPLAKRFIRFEVVEELLMYRN